MEKKKITLGSVLVNLDAIITCVTLTLCTIVVNANVLMRYFLKRPLYWSEEVATGLFVWTVFIGSAYAYRKHAHLGVDILINILPEKLLRLLWIFWSLLL
jgi:TRAP-type C4-dicarboxylate transport system permease small subunit